MPRANKGKTKKARELRANSTEAEKALWTLLRGLNQRFRRQHPVGDYILDFACVTAKVAVEADGGLHADNTHDAARDAWLALQGWRVLRFWNNDILGNGEGVVSVILDALQNPPPAGRGRGALLIGIGHPYRHDDSVGVKVAEALGGLIHHGEGTDLMARWQGHDDVVLVDASCSGAPPGTVTVLDASDKDLPAGMLPKGSHVFGVAEGIAMARLLGKLPKKLTVIAIEGSDFSAGEGLTPAVAEAVPQVLDLLRKRCS